MHKKILFITGTRADFGKVRPLITISEENGFEVYVFVTGMHTLNKYGYTANEVFKENFKNTHVYMNQISGEPMDLVLANTINGLSRYVAEIKPDLIIVHGDRGETLAGAIVGAFNNILVAHVEGGELSGTIDELIRHSVTKLSHIHFAANNDARQRLLQLGENSSSIWVIGSPDIDVMMSENLPSLEDVKNRYDVKYDDYGVVLFHPVTTEIDNLRHMSQELIQAIIESSENYVVIYPNNDEGSEEILNAYTKLTSSENLKLIPSMRFEYFLTLLKHAFCIMGNSSAGIREAPVYGVYSINIGNRQHNRYHCKSILNVDFNKNSIIEAVKEVKKMPKCFPSYHFGKGESAELFLKALQSQTLWKVPSQKHFKDNSFWEMMQVYEK